MGLLLIERLLRRAYRNNMRTAAHRERETEGLIVLSIAEYSKEGLEGKDRGLANLLQCVLQGE